ncbi:MAPEG family protein [Aliidiomarina sanyensis]|uniref:MAPEG family protein n=1 Tax=Aliidiomarina sanyensis TaxID=1249555 RepID=A0A432W515_9GAMM|nr:MAPEG family protein [Aliidiomarina sanyensis]RUO24944.1 hypothetical protein CWE11_11885 [Aliidiomarina sanyensis]
MTHLLITLFIAMILPYVAKLALVFAMVKQPGGYDNHYPRVQQRRLEGYGLRATAAHYNSFEALIIYMSAVGIVYLTDSVDTFAVALGWTFITARVLYLICYWADWATARSLIWLVSLFSAFFMAGRAIWG